MEYNQLKEKILDDLKNGETSCVKVIEDNKEIISTSLKNLNNVKEFIDDLNDIIMKSKTFTLIEKVLKLPEFALLTSEWKQSNVLIKACQNKNIKAINWLIKNMKVNLYVKDEFGRTALMYAVQNDLDSSVLNLLLNEGSDYVNLVDNNGNPALFYSLEKSCYSLLLETPGINVLQENNDGKTLAILLAENFLNDELMNLLKQFPSIDINYKNRNGDTIATFYIKKYYEHLHDEKSKNYLFYKEIAKTLKVLVNSGCNFNIKIDNDGNTPMMFFFFVEDYASANFVHNLSRGKPDLNIDLSVKNKYDINVSYLSLFINKKVFQKNSFLFTLKDFKKSLKANKTFDSSYLDSDIVIHENHEKESYYKPSPYNIKVQEWMHDTLYYINPDHSDAFYLSVNVKKENLKKKDKLAAVPCLIQ